VTLCLVNIDSKTDNGPAEALEKDPLTEVAAILRDLADRVSDGCITGPITDSTGAQVGAFTLVI
jgi:hypothetical protein